MFDAAGRVLIAQRPAGKAWPGAGSSPAASCTTESPLTTPRCAAGARKSAWQCTPPERLIRYRTPIRQHVWLDLWDRERLERRAAGSRRTGVQWVAPGRLHEETSSSGRPMIEALLRKAEKGAEKGTLPFPSQEKGNVPFSALFPSIAVPHPGVTLVSLQGVHHVVLHDPKLAAGSRSASPEARRPPASRLTHSWSSNRGSDAARGSGAEFIRRRSGRPRGRRIGLVHDGDEVLRLPSGEDRRATRATASRGGPEPARLAVPVGSPHER